MVQVKACGVNYPDVLIIEDKYQFKPPRPFAPGGEISGVVKAVGEGVTHVKPGDRVLGNTGWGGMAEELALEAARLMHDPRRHAVRRGGGVPHDLWHLLLRAEGPRPPEARRDLLVLGAAGGVGLAAVELGKAMGARVIAAASSQEKVDLAQGARRGRAAWSIRSGPFDRDGQKALADLFKQAAGPSGATWSTTASAATTPRRRCARMAWEGRFLVIGFPAGIPRIPLNLALLKGCDIVGVFWGAAVSRDPAAHQQNVNELMALYAAGKIKPHVSEHFPLARAAEAITHLASRKAMGKVVVMVD